MVCVVSESTRMDVEVFSSPPSTLCVYIAASVRAASSASVSWLRSSTGSMASNSLEEV